MCPHCGREAPIVYRGVIPYCTACGGLRLPLSGRSVNLAGKPAQLGGAVASAAGLLVLVSGLALSVIAGGLIGLLATVTAGLVVGLPIAFVALVLGLLLLARGRTLQRSGHEVERTTLEDALLALAQQRGSVSAAEAARVLGVAPDEADELLTGLAKRTPERLGVEVDDQGVVWYVAGARIAPPHVRVAAGAEGAGDAGASERAAAAELEAAYSAPESEGAAARARR